MTKLLPATLHRFVTVCATRRDAMEKCESPSSGQELTEWTDLSNGTAALSHSET